MSRIYTAADQLIGHTPLLELTHIEKKENLNAHILAKLEYFNPAGSVKDRIAKGMIDDAEAKGLLKEGSVIIEPTSGNTGIHFLKGIDRGFSVERKILLLTLDISDRHLDQCFRRNINQPQSVNRAFGDSINSFHRSLISIHLRFIAKAFSRRMHARAVNGRFLKSINFKAPLID